MQVTDKGSTGAPAAPLYHSPAAQLRRASLATEAYYAIDKGDDEGQDHHHYEGDGGTEPTKLEAALELFTRP